MGINMRTRRIISISLAAVIICIIYQAEAFFIKGKNPTAITDGQQAAENRDGLTASTDVSPAGGEGTPYTGGINPNPGAHNTSPGENSSHSGGNGPGSAGDNTYSDGNNPRYGGENLFSGGDIPGPGGYNAGPGGNGTNPDGRNPDSVPGGKNGGEGAEKGSSAYKDPLTYRNLKTEIGGYEQVINILEIDISKADVKPLLSYDLIYGFEKLSDMVSRTGAYAAVNGGFFHEYGEPGGMVMVDGEIYTLPTGNYPVFIVEENTARITGYKSDVYIKSGNSSIKLDELNNWEKPSAMVAYTPIYGSTNRAKGDNITARIENGVVVRVDKVKGESEIPRSGMLITLYPPYTNYPEGIPLEPGNRVSLEYSPGLGESVHAYECGAWLVKDGKNVAGKSDPWVGLLTNRDPRTAVGVKDKGATVVLLTVDGRQPGYSEGLTAKELADLLIEIGVEDAAMLDGGASTEMIVDGEIVNRPSYRGQERKIAGALAVFCE
jgi:exopolysaccharide biosynthesis protein